MWWNREAEGGFEGRICEGQASRRDFARCSSSSSSNRMSNSVCSAIPSAARNPCT